MASKRWLLLATLLVVGSAGCRDRTPEPKGRSAAPARQAEPNAVKPAAPTPQSAETGRFRRKAPGRVVAIGDVHGDLEAARHALRLAGAIDDGDRWTGGDLVVVQTGDQLDRADDERAILELFDVLDDQARQAGGAVYSLNGNHEIMNVAGDFRYVTPGGYRDFADLAERASPSDPRFARVPPHARGRAAAFFPGGPYALRLARREVVLMVNDTVFVHGGVLPEYARYGIDRINSEVSRWMRGAAPAPPEPVMAEHGPVWSRHYGTDPPGCDLLEKALEELGAGRMVVGHTVQKGGISSACHDRVWRIDVGLARYYGGIREVLEISDGKVRVLKGETAGPAVEN